MKMNDKQIDRIIVNLEKQWNKKTKKPKKLRLPRKNPRRPLAGKQITVSIQKELIEWMETCGYTWLKSDIINSALVLLYMMENKGNLPDELPINSYPLRHWEGDRITQPKKWVLKNRRKKHKEKLAKTSDKKRKANKTSDKKPKTSDKNRFDSLEIESNGFDWDD